jgi:hypothetical protein
MLIDTGVLLEDFFKKSFYGSIISMTKKNYLQFQLDSFNLYLDNSNKFQELKPELVHSYCSTSSLCLWLLGMLNGLHEGTGWQRFLAFCFSFLEPHKMTANHKCVRVHISLYWPTRVLWIHQSSSGNTDYGLDCIFYDIREDQELFVYYQVFYCIVLSCFNFIHWLFKEIIVFITIQ